MKTTHYILLSLAFFSALFTNAQLLQVKGKVVSYKEEAIPAQFALFKNDTLVQSGYSDEFRLNLALDQNYEVQIYRPGYQTKSIQFTTTTPISKKFRFSFTVMLNKLHGISDKEEVKTAGCVYFDETKKLFDYTAF